MTPPEAIKLVAQLASAFPRTPLLDLTQATYADNMVDLSAEVGAAAVQRLIRTVKWLPTIAEIRAAAVDVACDELSPAEAWEEVTHNLSFYEDPRFSSPLIKRAVDCLGGVKTLALMQYDKLCFERNKFMEIYGNFRERKVNDQRIGLVEIPSQAEAVALLEEVNSTARRVASESAAAPVAAAAARAATAEIQRICAPIAGPPA
jgi:hypothetical protein